MKLDEEDKRIIFYIAKVIQRYPLFCRFLRIDGKNSDSNSILQAAYNIEICVSRYDRGYVIKQNNIAYSISFIKSTYCLGVILIPPKSFEFNKKIENYTFFCNVITSLEKDYPFPDSDEYILPKSHFVSLLHLIVYGFIFEMFEELEVFCDDYFDENKGLDHPVNILCDALKCPGGIIKIFIYIIHILLHYDQKIKIKNKKLCNLYDLDEINKNKFSEDELHMFSDMFQTGVNKDAVNAMINCIINFREDFMKSIQSEEDIIKLIKSEWFEVLYIAYTYISHDTGAYELVLEHFDDTTKKIFLIDNFLERQYIENKMKEEFTYESDYESDDSDDITELCSLLKNL